MEKQWFIDEDVPYHESVCQKCGEHALTNSDVLCEGFWEKLIEEECCHIVFVKYAVNKSMILW